MKILTNEKKNIKNYKQYLWTFIVINFCIYLCIALGKNINFNNLNETYKSFIVKDSIIAAISALVTFILNGLLSSNMKYILVFWKFKNPLPGCRVFTELINKDCRIDKAVLIEKYGSLPTEAEEQNKLWYKIYKTNEFDPMIFDSQRNFLISRDLTGLSSIFLPIYPIAVLISGIKIKIALVYLAFLVIQYILLIIVCRNYGNRFACNALAKASCNVE